MSLQDTKKPVQPQLKRTVQKPVKNGQNMVSTLPPGMTEKDRSLVDQLTALFFLHEADEFANPQDNTERNRVDRFIKEMSDLSYDTLVDLSSNDDVLKAVKERIEQSIPSLVDSLPKVKESASDSGKTTDKSENLNLSLIKKRLQEEISKRNKEWKKGLDTLSKMLDSKTEEAAEEVGKSQQEEKKSTSSPKGKEGKKKNVKGEEEKKKKDSGIKEVPIEEDAYKQITSSKEKVSTSDKTMKDGISSGKLADTVGKALDIIGTSQNKKIAKMARSIAATQERIAKFRAQWAAVGQTKTTKLGKGFGYAKLIMGPVLTVGASIVGAVAGAVVGIAKLTANIISGIWKLAKAAVKTVASVVNQVLIKPTKWVTQLLFRRTFPLLMIALTTPAGMYALGYAIGRIVKFFRGGIGQIITNFKNLFSNVRLFFDEVIKPLYDDVVDRLKRWTGDYVQSIKDEWEKYKDAHPNLKTFLESAGNVLEDLKTALEITYDFFDEKITGVCTWWTAKMEEYNKKYEEYVKSQEEFRKKVMEEGKDPNEVQTMSKDIFFADQFHNDLAAKLSELGQAITGIVNDIAPLINIGASIAKYIFESSWIIPAMKLLVCITEQTTGSPAAAVIMTGLQFLYGPLGWILGSFISYSIEQATLGVVDWVKRKEAVMQSSSEMLQIFGNPHETGEQVIERKIKKTKDFLAQVDLNRLDQLVMADDSNTLITDSQKKRDYVLELLNRFNKDMNEDITATNNIIQALNRLRLISDHGRSLSYSTSLEDMFRDTGVINRQLLHLAYFNVDKMFGISSERLISFMNQRAGGTWSDRANNVMVNKVAMNIVRLRMKILADLYGKINSLIDMQGTPGVDPEYVLFTLYSYLSPNGKMYQFIRNTLMQSNKMEEILSEVIGSDDFRTFDENTTNAQYERLNSIVGISDLMTVDKALKQLVGLQVRDPNVERHAQSDNESSARHKAGLQAMRESKRELDSHWLWRNIRTDSDFLNSLLIIPALQDITAYIAGRNMVAENDLAVKKYGYVGDQDFGPFYLGPNRVTTIGNKSLTYLGTGGFSTQMFADTIERLSTGMEIKYAEAAKILYEGFYSDLDNVATGGFRNTASHLGSELARLSEIDEPTFEDLKGNGFTAAMNGILLKIYNTGGAAEAEELQRFMDKVGKDLSEMANGDRDIFFEKYGKKTISEIVDEFVREQMESAGLSDEQRNFIWAYFRGFDNASEYMKRAIANKTIMNQKMRDTITALEKKLEQSAAGKGR